MSTTTKVSQLPAAVTPLAGDEEVMLVQSGTSRRATVDDIAAAGASLTADHIALGGGAGNPLTEVASLGSSTTVLHGNASGAPTFGAVSLTTDVSGDLPYSNLAQGAGLSVLGVTGNATADVASIAAGTDNQVLRRSGTSVAFGAVNLASAAAVTGALAITNGGTGQTAANDALNALLPSQGAHSGEFLTTDGTNTSWAAAGAAAAPDLIFIAASVGGTPGWSDFGTTGGTLIYENTSRLSGVFGFAGISLNSVAPSELELKLQGTFAQSDFTSLVLMTWGQTLLTADATFSTPGGNSVWSWTSPEADMVVSGQYSFRFN